MWPFHCSCVPTSVDPDDLPGDVARLVADEVRAGGRDVLRTSDATHGSPRRGRVDAVTEEALRLGPAQHRGVDEARRDRVDGDALGPELERQRLGEADDSGLRRDVVR